MKKHLEISSFYTSALKIMIIGYTVPEIWNVTDVIAIFILSYTIPFCPPTAQKLKISKQWKKDLQISSFYTLVPKIIIICYTISEIWHVSDVIIFILGNFLPFYPPNSPKNEISKHWKHILEISSFYTSVLKSWSYAILFLRYGAWQMCVIDVIVIFHFGLLFALLLPTAQKIKISQTWKKRQEISFYICVPKNDDVCWQWWCMVRWCMVPEIWGTTDGRTDKKKVTYRDGCPT